MVKLKSINNIHKFFEMEQPLRHIYIYMSFDFFLHLTSYKYKAFKHIENK